MRPLEPTVVPTIERRRPAAPGERRGKLPSAMLGFRIISATTEYFD
jgi:hypothetical protein